MVKKRKIIKINFPKISLKKMIKFSKNHYLLDENYI